MPDVFISNSTKDQEVADFVCRHLKAENIDGTATCTTAVGCAMMR
jgi:hypothetical protein